MEITEVRVSLRESAGPPTAGGRGTDRRLKAYATVTFDRCFVVRNIKIIDGKNGLFVAMPSHKPKVGCERCRFKNDAGGRFCSQCGAPLPVVERSPAGSGAEVTDAAAHRDIAHPITVEFRQYLQRKVLEAYEVELEKNRSGSASPAIEHHEAL